MANKPPFLKNMMPMDWMLGVLFIVVLGVLGNSLFPGAGILIGVLVALGLLYLAKRRRDRMQERNGKDQD